MAMTGPIARLGRLASNVLRGAQHGARGGVLHRRRRRSRRHIARPSQGCRPRRRDGPRGCDRRLPRARGRALRGPGDGRVRPRCVPAARARGSDLLAPASCRRSRSASAQGWASRLGTSSPTRRSSTRARRSPANVHNAGRRGALRRSPNALGVLGTSEVGRRAPPDPRARRLWPARRIPPRPRQGGAGRRARLQPEAGPGDVSVDRFFRGNVRPTCDTGIGSATPSIAASTPATSPRSTRSTSSRASATRAIRSMRRS